MTEQEAGRRRDLGEIHQLKAKLGLDDDAYRALLQAETGKSSSAGMSREERWKVMLRLRRDVGAQVLERRERARRKPHNLDGDDQLKKVEALLAEMKLPWSYANGMARRMYHVDAIAWCDSDQLRGIITALIRHGQRHGHDVKR